MNVYDFDKTLYKNDSTADFYKFCLRRYKRIALLLPYQGILAALFALGLLKRGRFKEKFFVFVKYIPDIETCVDAFWRAHEHNLLPWYEAVKADDDVVISASPEFMLRPICAQMGVKTLLATRIDPRTGKMTGENCRDQEKVRRLLETYPDAQIDRFYSDSYSDQPLADMAKQPFLVRDGVPGPWYPTMMARTP